MHQAIIKAKRIGRVAKEHNWRGSIESEVVHGKRITVLSATRNDETILLRWDDNLLTKANYSISFSENEVHLVQLACAKEALDRIEGWPDLEDLFKWFPDQSRCALAEKYRRVPFNWREDSDEEILSKIVGRKIFWYSHISQRTVSDVVLELKGKKAKNIQIRHIEHRKMLNFIGKDAGFRSVLLDTVFKVA